MVSHWQLELVLILFREDEVKRRETRKRNPREVVHARLLVLTLICGTDENLLLMGSKSGKVALFPREYRDALNVFPGLLVCSYSLVNH